MRSVRRPLRSARRLTFKAPVMLQSRSVLPSPKSFSGSLLVTETMRAVTFLPELSVAFTVTVIGTILWFGGQRQGLLGVTLTTTGGSVSPPGSRRTVTVKVPTVVLPALSVAMLVTVVTPTGKVDPEGGVLMTVGTEQLSVAVTL